MKRVRSFLLLSCTALVSIASLRLPRVIFGDISLQSRSGYISSPSTTAIRKAGEPAPFVAIVACIKSGHYQPARFIETTLLPSIYETITKEERAAYRVELILGYDHDDEYWQQEHNHHLSPKGENGASIYDDQEPIPVNYVAIRKDADGSRPNRIPFNELCQSAYDYGATYIARINDDSQFSSKGWITVATDALRSFDPPNVGVVGPTCLQGNQEIMTHDFVHVPTHLSIFGTYYPQVFDNYYVDDWITRVYGEERTRQLGDWELLHHLETFWTRYEPTFDQDQMLNQTVDEGRERVEQFVLEKRGVDIDELRVLGKPETIESVDGPIQKVHLSFMKKTHQMY